jgi:hypothetical protein
MIIGVKSRKIGGVLLVINQIVRNQKTLESVDCATSILIRCPVRLHMKNSDVTSAGNVLFATRSVFEEKYLTRPRTNIVWNQIRRYRLIIIATCIIVVSVRKT